MSCATPRSGHCLLGALPVALFLILGSAVSHATVDFPDVLIRPEIPTKPLTEGSAFEIPVDVYVALDVSAPVVSMRADGPTDALALTPDMALSRIAPPPGYSHERHVLRGRLEPGVDRVRLQVTVDGVVWEEAIRLRGFGDAWDEDSEVDPMLARDITSGVQDAGSHEKPEPVASGYPTPEVTLARAARTVNVQGRVMTRINGTGTLREVDGVTVYFMQVRGILDDLELGRATTDVNGFFDFDVSMDGIHDVYLKVRAINAVVNVGTDAGFQTYGRNTGRRSSFGGTSINFGTRIFGGDMNHALWLASTLTRSHRWYAERGFTLPQVNCRWRDDVLGSSCYLPVLGMEGIHLRSSATWNSGTVVHEYGHHFVAASSVNEVWPPFYTNGICDPGHCGTCPENEAVAWSEGLPYFLAQEINRDHGTTYGWAPPGLETFESVGTCTATGNFGENPQSTEDFLAALCNDIVDANPDGSPLAPGITENLDLTVADVLFVASTMPGSDSLSFVDAFRSFLSSGLFTDQQRREYWAACAVNGFASDSTPPTPPSIGVPTHPSPFVATASNLPFMVFNGATDDDSGVDRYRISINAAPGAPSGTIETTSESALTWPFELAEGTWFINVQAVDRAGNASTAVNRQITVGPSLPLDLRPYQPGLWEDDFLLRHDTSVTSAAGAVSPVLIGGQPFWVSLSSWNDSPSGGVIPYLKNVVLMNGDVVHNEVFSDTLMGSLEVYQSLNVGPFELPGGRHHFAVLLDADQVVAEEDNDNNRYNRYVVFRPSLLSSGSWQVFPEPPRPYTTGAFGFQSIPNQSGHRVQTSNVFGAVMMATADINTNYALRFYDGVSTGIDSGFDFPRTISDNDYGRTEVVVYNTDALGRSNFDVGIERKTLGALTNYSMRHENSQVLSPGDDTTVFWSDQDELTILEFDFNVFNFFGMSISVQATFEPDDPYRDVELYWMDPDRQVLRPHLVDADAVTDEDGFAYFNPALEGTGTYSLVIVRDTRPGAGSPGFEGGSVPRPVSFVVSTRNSSTVDFGFYRDEMFWEMPFIPSLEPVQGPGVPVPSDLIGGGFSTYLNFAIENLGRQTNTENLVVIADLDGVSGQQFLWTEFGEIPGGGFATSYGANPVFVEGGRHTMTLTIDPFDQFAEGNENNNVLSVQFGWKGPDLIPFSNMTMGSPPDPEAGFDTFEQFTTPTGIDGEESVDAPVNFAGLNSHGFRIPPTLNRAAHERWRAVATMPTANVDVDVRLHEVLPPAQAFTNAYATSTSLLGESDFVLIDGHATENVPYDVSVVRSGGNDSYTIVQVDAQSLGSLENGSGSFGPFGLDGGGILDLYEVVLEPGAYNVSMNTTSGIADLGLTVYFPTQPLQQPYYSKDDGSDRVPGSNLAAGAPEKVTFEVRPGEEGVFCFAVWKARAADFQENVDYTIDVIGNPAPPECHRIDGKTDFQYPTVLAVQTVQTQFGDADLGRPDAANGSELDLAFAEVCDGKLHLFLSGNLESNYNDLEVFIDTRPGGQNRLRGDNASFDGQVDLNRMGDDGSGNGLTFAPTFEPDWWFGVQGGFAEVTTGMPYKMAAYQAELLTGGEGPGWSLGYTTAPSRGLLQGVAADNPFGVRVAIDNSNTAGVDAGTGAGTAGGVATGVEFSIPLEAIGSPTDCMRIVAFVNGRRHDFVSNQVLPPLPVGTGNLGEPREVDFSFVGDSHWFTVCQGISTDVDPDDVPSTIDRAITLHAPAPNPFNPRTQVSFDLPRAASVELALYDVSGRRVRTLVARRTLDAGRHELVWDGTDDNGHRVASGAYLVRMVSEGTQHVRRVVLLK